MRYGEQYDDAGKLAELLGEAQSELRDKVRAHREANLPEPDIMFKLREAQHWYERKAEGDAEQRRAKAGADLFAMSPEAASAAVVLALGVRSKQ